MAYTFEEAVEDFRIVMTRDHIRAAVEKLKDNDKTWKPSFVPTRAWLDGERIAPLEDTEGICLTCGAYWRCDCL